MDKEQLKREAIKSYNIIKKGGLVLGPSDIGYGLFGHSEKSIRLMFDLKGRPKSNPCIVIGNIQVFKEIADVDNKTFEILKKISTKYICAFVVNVNKNSEYTRNLPVWVMEHSTKGETIGIFLNTGFFTEKLTELGMKDKFLIVGSSANISGTGNNYSLKEVEDSIKNNVAYKVNGGKSKNANKEKLATTIINLVTNTVKRRGVFYSEILKDLKRLGVNISENS